MKFNILSVLQLSLMEYLNFYLAFERKSCDILADQDNIHC